MVVIVVVVVVGIVVVRVGTGVVGMDAVAVAGVGVGAGFGVDSLIGKDAGGAEAGWHFEQQLVLLGDGQWLSETELAGGSKG